MAPSAGFGFESHTFGASFVPFVACAARGAGNDFDAAQAAP
jgi:hypothetical protein